TPILGPEAVIGGATYVVTTIAEPGVIRQTGTIARIRCGRTDRRPDPVLAGYVDAANAASIDITLSDDMLTDLCKKFVLLVGTSGSTASTRQTVGVIRADPDMLALMLDLMAEARAVGRASGVPLRDDFVQELEPSIAGFNPAMKASLANDLDRGNRLEL